MPSSPLAEERMIGLGHVSLQTDGGNGGVKPELKLKWLGEILARSFKVVNNNQGL